MSLAVFEHDPPSAAETELAQEQLADIDSRLRSVREAVRALAVAMDEAGVLDKRGTRPPFRANLTSAEAIEGSTEIVSDLFANLLDAESYAELCARAEADE